DGHCLRVLFVQPAADLGVGGVVLARNGVGLRPAQLRFATRGVAFRAGERVLLAQRADERPQGLLLLGAFAPLPGQLLLEADALVLEHGDATREIGARFSRRRAIGV